MKKKFRKFHIVNASYNYSDVCVILLYIQFWNIEPTTALDYDYDYIGMSPNFTEIL